MLRSAPGSRGRALAFLFVLLLVSTSSMPALAQPPESLVASFCEADARGDRLSPARSAVLTDGLGWRFEPAWDRFFMISGYEVRPLSITADEAQVEVRYSVVAEVSGEGVRDEERIASVHFTLMRRDGTWRLVGAPPPPYLSASAVGKEQLFALLTPLEPEYVSSSKFVWRMLINAGWSFPYQTTAAYLGSSYFKPVAEPSLGDVVAYLAHGSPYHIGIYLGEDRIVSATMHGGILRSPLNAFPGEIRYLRLTEAARAPGATPEPTKTSKAGDDEDGGPSLP